jgi:hypothetical protein
MSWVLHRAPARAVSSWPTGELSQGDGHTSFGSNLGFSCSAIRPRTRYAGGSVHLASLFDADFLQHRENLGERMRAEPAEPAAQ